VAPVLTQEGQGFLVHPWTGEVKSVPEGDVPNALAAGLVPATAEQAAKFKTGEHYGTAGMQALAGLAGVARGATFGGSDIALRGVVHPESMRQAREAHPITSGVAEAGGSIGSFIIPGAPGAHVARLGARAGAKAGHLAARIPGKTGEIAARAAQPMVREGVTGAALSTGAAVSDVVLEQMEGEEAARRLATGFSHGAAFGAGLGVLAFGGGVAKRAVERRFDSGIGKIKRLREDRSVIGAEIDALKASVPKGAPAPASVESRLIQLEDSLSGVTASLDQAQSELLGRVATRAVAAGLAVALDAGVTGGVLGTIVAPRALAAVKNMVLPAAQRAGGRVAHGVGGVLEKGTPWVSRARDAWKTLRGIPIVGEAAEAAGQAAIRRAPGAVAGAARTAAKKVPGASAVLEQAAVAAESVGRRAASGASEAVGRGAEVLDAATGAALTGTGRAALQGYMSGGVTGALTAGVAYESKHRLMHLGDLAVQKIVPAAKVAALDNLSNRDWEQVAEEVPHMDTGGLQALIAMQTPDGTPDHLQNAMTNQILKSIGYLKEEAPKRQESDIPSGAEPRPSSQEQREFVEKVKAVFLPDSLMSAFIAGNTPAIAAGVKTWQAVYPEALEQLRAVMQASVDEATAKGHRYSRREAHKIALVTGDRGPRMYDAQRVAMLQAQYQGQKQRGPKPRAKQMSGLDSAVATPTQRALT
jgi:hypothetical protein